MLLQRTLLANASFCLLCGLGLVFFTNAITTFAISLPTWLLLGVGLGLIAFAVDVYWLSQHLDRAKNRVFAVFWGDVAWVVMTPIVLILFATHFSALGQWLMIEIAVIVAIFAWLEWRGASKYYSTPRYA